MFLIFAFHVSEPLGEEVNMDNVKQKLIKNVEDAKTVFQNYEDKCNEKQVICLVYAGLLRKRRKNV